jgi:hypothetical protein
VGRWGGEGWCPLVPIKDQAKAVISIVQESSTVKELGAHQMQENAGSVALSLGSGCASLPVDNETTDRKGEFGILALTG